MSSMSPDNLAYRAATLPDEVPQIVALLEANGQYWPGAAATPYVAVNQAGEVVAVFFKTLCFHAEPACARPGSGFSIGKLADLMKESFVDLATELGYPLIVYSVVQDTARGRAAAEKNGMRPSPGVLYEIAIAPRQEVVAAGATG